MYSFNPQLSEWQIDNAMSCETRLEESAESRTTGSLDSDLTVMHALVLKMQQAKENLSAVM